MLCGISTVYVSYLLVELEGVLFFSVSTDVSVLYLLGVDSVFVEGCPEWKYIGKYKRNYGNIRKYIRNYGNIRVLFFSVSAGGGVLYLPGALLYSRRVAPSGKSNSRGTMMGAAGWQITISIMLKFNPSILEMFLSDSQIAK